MVLLILATLCSGLFAGAAIYITLVEHPARLACGPALALRQFAPSYRRAAVMQGSLALVGCAVAVAAGLHMGEYPVVAGGVLLGAVVPFTLVVMLPTNQRLLAAADSEPEAASVGELLHRWGRLHAVRSVLGLVSFAIIAGCLAAR